MSLPSLLIVGASCRAAAESARRAGFQPTAVDLFADRDLAAVAAVERVARFPEDFPAAAARVPAMPWMYLGGLENYPEIVTAITARRPLWGNDGETLRNVRDPHRFAACSAAAGLPGPPIKIALESTDHPADWLCKNASSSGGLGVRRADAREARSGGYFQAFVPGISASAGFVSAGEDVRLLGVSRQLTGFDDGAPRPFQYAGSLAPFPLPGDGEARLTAWGRRLSREFRLCGVWGVDFLVAGEDLLPLEINPRYCASFEILEKVFNFNSIELQAAACCGRRLPPPQTAPPPLAAGKQVVYAAEDCQAGAALDIALQLLGEADVTAADLPPPGEQFRPGDPVLTLLATASTVEGVSARLREGTARIREVLASPKR